MAMNTDENLRYKLTPHTPVALVGPIHQLNRIHKKETQRVEFLDGKIAK